MMSPISITKKARAYWSEQISSQSGVGIFLKFSQVGCFGWQFMPSVVLEQPEDTEAYQHGECLIFIKTKDIERIQGTTIDYDTDLAFGQSKIIYQHPLAKSHCGCGESFVLEDAS